MSQLDVRFLVMALATVLIGRGSAFNSARPGPHLSFRPFIFLPCCLGRSSDHSGAVEAISHGAHQQAVALISSMPAPLPFQLSYGMVVTVISARRDVAGFVLDQSPRWIFGDGLYSVRQNSLLVATSSALKAETSVWGNMAKEFLWLRYVFRGRSAAALIARSSPRWLLAFVSQFDHRDRYFTYLTYLKTRLERGAQANRRASTLKN